MTTKKTAKPEEKKTYKPPMVYFGTKHKIVKRVWEILNHDGKATHSVEPFAGTSVFTLNRPETITRALVNDVDGFLINAIRTVARDPLALAKELEPFRAVHRSQADVHGCDNVVRQKRGWLTAAVSADPGFFDPKLAAYYLYGNNNYLASGFGIADGPWIERESDGVPVLVNRKSMDSTESGKKWGAPNAGDQGLTSGLKRQVPDVNDRGLTPGLKRQVPDVNDRGLTSNSSDLEALNIWASKLNGVDVYCSNWESVVSNSAVRAENKTSMPVYFLDPPYETTQDSMSINVMYWTPKPFSAKVLREWCIENQNKRIVLCGYDVEHDELLVHGWTKEAWLKNSGYGTQETKDAATALNIKNEFLWISPACAIDFQE